MVPTRDGVRLRTIVFTPKDTTVLGTVILRTRRPHRRRRVDFHTVGPAESFAQAGYIFAFQDVRGKFLSEGTFIDVPPVHDHPGPGEVDEATDTYDSIDWLLKHIRHNNGRVGQYGIRYLGYYSTLGDPEAGTPPSRRSRRRRR